MRTSNVAVLAHRAAAMRGALTTSEAALWGALKGSQLGVGFRRQFVVGGYIVDFCAPSVKVIVEVDGGYHVRQARADARREKALGKLGYRVMRVSSELVLGALPEAVAAVRAALAR